MSMTILSWLLAGAQAKRALDHVNQQIAEKERAIQQWDKGIEATQPVVEEAIKQTDNVYYKLRSEVKRAERRKEKIESDLFVRDLTAGWRAK